MYDYMANEQPNWQQHNDRIRDAEQFRKVQAAQARHQPLSQRIATPVRRAAHLVTAIIR